jgi:CheY-like chemotaxis protein
MNAMADFTRDDIVLVTSEQYKPFVIEWQELRGAQSPDISPIVVVVDTFSDERTTIDMDSFFRPLRIREPLRPEEYAALAAGRPDLLTRESAEDGLTEHSSVLVVDDDTVNLMVSKKMIERLGYSVHAVNRSAAALEVLQGTRFAVACIDIEMPGMNGWELVKRIRGGEAGSAAQSMPLIAVTGHSAKEITSRAVAHGFASVLSKPFTVDQIDRVLRNANARHTSTSRSETVRSGSGGGAETPVAEAPAGVVSLPTAKVKRAIESNNLDRAGEILRDTRARVVSTPDAEVLFRIQLALRRGDKETAVRLLEELESLGRRDSENIDS